MDPALSPPPPAAVPSPPPPPPPNQTAAPTRDEEVPTDTDGFLMGNNHESAAETTDEDAEEEEGGEEERTPLGLTFTHISYKGKLVFLNAEDTPFYKKEEIEPNVQEIIGVTPACSCISEYQTWYSFTSKARLLHGPEKRKHKALYRIALDFDIPESDEDVVVEAVSKLLYALSIRYANITDVLDDAANPIKVAYLTRPSSKRWHVQLLNISFASRRIEAGASILSSIKSCIMRDVLSMEDISPDVEKVVGALDVEAGGHHWLMYGSKKNADVPDAYHLAFIAHHHPLTGASISRSTAKCSDSPIVLRRMLSMHRTYDSDALGRMNEACIDYETGLMYHCRSSSMLSLGMETDSEDVRNAMEALRLEEGLAKIGYDAAASDAAYVDCEAEELLETVMKMQNVISMPSSSSSSIKRNRKKDQQQSQHQQAAATSPPPTPPRIQDHLDEDEELHMLDEDEDEEYDMIMDTTGTPSIGNGMDLMEYASLSRSNWREVVEHMYKEGTQQLNEMDRRRKIQPRPVINDLKKCIELARKYKKPGDKGSMRSDLERRAFILAMVKLVFEYGYAVKYDLWFGRLTPLIVSNLGYSGLSFYRALCTNACAAHIGDDATIAYNRCVQYLFETSPTHDEQGNEYKVVMPRAVFRPRFESPFVMTAEEHELSIWIMNTYAKCNFITTPFFIKYVFYMVELKKCVLVHDACEDRYETLRYNPSMGIYQTDPILNMILPLQSVLFKTILHNLTCKDPYAPLDLLFKLYDGLSAIINQQKPLKIDNSVADVSLYKCNLSREYIVFSNGYTFNCETSKFERWNERHVCMHRVDLDPELGLNELIEHATVEVHPLRGGRRYLYKLLHGFIYGAQKLFNEKYTQLFSCHAPKCSDLMIWRSMVHMFPPEDFERIDAIATLYTTDPSSVSEEDSEFLHYAYKMACMHFIITSFVASRPDLYVELLNNGDLVANIDNPNVDDDDGPVVIVRRQLTYEQKVWALFDDMFGSREQSMIVMRYLALGLRTGGTGRHVLYLHGEAMNGKSVFMQLVKAAMGGDGSKMIIHLNGDYFSPRQSTLDATFRTVNVDARFLFLPEMCVLEMGPAGMRRLKRLTGGDVITERGPFSKKNNNFVNNAKLITTSNEIPYLTASDTAEISRFLIVPMRSCFNMSVSQVRTKHLRRALNQRATHRMFGLEEGAYPAVFTDYVREHNSAANCMFGEIGIGMKAIDALLPTYPPITKQYVPPLIKHVPSSRHMLADKNLMDSKVMEKCGAGLIRILTREIIPSMNGVTVDTVDSCCNEFDAITHRVYAQMATYKDMMTAIVLNKLVRVRDNRCFVVVEELRLLASNDLVNVRKTYSRAMYGAFYSVNKVNAIESDINNAFASLPRFQNALLTMGLKSVPYNGRSTSIARGTPVIYGFLLIEHFNDRIAHAINEQTLLTAMTDDSHIRQYESAFNDMVDEDTMDAFVRRKFMKPVEGADPNVYGSSYEEYNSVDVNNEYLAMSTPQRFNSAMNSYGRIRQAVGSKVSRSDPAAYAAAVIQAVAQLQHADDDDEHDTDTEAAAAAEEEEEEDEDEVDAIQEQQADADRLAEELAEAEMEAVTLHTKRHGGKGCSASSSSEEKRQRHYYDYDAELPEEEQ